MRPPPKDEEEALLQWAEERLIGQYEACWACNGRGRNRTAVPDDCFQCDGSGDLPREAYLEAERALTESQRRSVGEQLLVERICSPDVSVFQLEDDG